MERVNCLCVAMEFQRAKVRARVVTPCSVRRNSPTTNRLPIFSPGLPQGERTWHIPTENCHSLPIQGCIWREASRTLQIHQSLYYRNLYTQHKGVVKFWPVVCQFRNLHFRNECNLRFVWDICQIFLLYVLFYSRTLIIRLHCKQLKFLPHPPLL
jgi:hypothetical protein